MPSSSYRHHRPRFIITSVLFLFAVLPLLAGSPAIANPSQQTPTAQATDPILLTDPVPDPKQPGIMWFAPTGHTLRGAFLEYWNKYGGLAQFGYPLTEEFVEQDSENVEPYTVQYFERARFEHHPENKGTEYEVLLGVLGRDFHPQNPPAAPLPPPALYFQETGHNLSGPFKAYWETHGGLFVNGYPITEAFEETNPIDGKSYLVQYFERSRLEYHPENKGSPYEVLLGLLGRQLMQEKGYLEGAYPRYGRALDYSWLSGEGGRGYDVCIFFRYDGKQNLIVDFVRPQTPISGEIRRKLYQGDPMTVFGRIGPPGDPNVCGEFRGAPLYYSTHVQPNPTP